jgi:hypothetical protein
MSMKDQIKALEEKVEALELQIDVEKGRRMEALRSMYQLLHLNDTWDAVADGRIRSEREEAC